MHYIQQLRSMKNGKREVRNWLFCVLLEKHELPGNIKYLVYDIHVTRTTWGIWQR